VADATIQGFGSGVGAVGRDEQTGKRRRYRLKARTREAAEAEAVDVYRKETRANLPDDPTIEEIWNAYVAELGEQPTARTMRSTGKAVLPFFDGHHARHITKAKCEAYAAKRMAQGRKQGTVWTELGHLRSALKWAARVGMIDRAPHVWRPEKPESDKRILNPGEIRKLIDAADAPHIRLAMILLFGTAARVSAILELTWDRVDFDANSINLRVETQQRRKGRAVVPMNASVRAALCASQEAALSDHVIEYAAKPIKSIRTGWGAAVERADLGRVTIHEARHTAAVTMLQAGVPLVKVSQMLGHSSVSITEKVYARFLPAAMQDAADVLDFMNPQKVR